jgi:hypothetical protein
MTDQSPPAQTTTLERLLLDDLDVEGERAADERFCIDLYRALARNVWRNDRDAEGRLSPSFGRAEWLVGEWRARHGHGAVTLAQTGDEGEVSETVAEVLGRLGWTHRPLQTDRDEAAHLGLPDSPPPPDHGERMAPVPDSDADERAAHEAAEAERGRQAG